jgi:hypothetical protein
LIPHGWQRAGAIARLFDRRNGQLPAPSQLIAPSYSNGDNHRTHQTIQPLSLLLHVWLECPYAVGEEAKLAWEVAAAVTGVTLICWEHQNIPKIAMDIPTPPGTRIPTKWPDDRFDMVWAFALDPATQQYAFSQIPLRCRQPSRAATGRGIDFSNPTGLASRAYASLNAACATSGAELDCRGVLGSAISTDETNGPLP